MTLRVLAAGGAVLLVLAYALLSGRWVSTSGAWYLSLEQPWWQPPPAVFGLIWPYNFAVLIAAGIVVALNAAPIRVVAFLVLLAASIAAAIAWAYLFYVPHQLVGAAMALTAAAVITLPILWLAFAERIWLGAILVPYQLWLGIAASLSWGYVALAD